MQRSFFKYICISSQMVQNENKNAILKITLRELLLYLIFLVLLTILTAAMVYPSMYYFTKIMQELFVEKNFKNVDDIEIKFEDIKITSDFWSFIEQVLVDGFHWDYWYHAKNPINETNKEDRKVLFENKLLGVPRLRQLRVGSHSCNVHRHFSNIIKHCYNSFTKASEDTSDFVSNHGKVWPYKTAKETGSINYGGSITTYHGGGIYQDLSLDKNKTKEIIRNLKQNLWVTRGTRCIFIDFTVYNANLNLFCIAKIVFEFPATGGIIPSTRIQTVQLIRYFTYGDYLIMVVELILMCFIVFYTLIAIKEILHLRCNYFRRFWNYIDLLILLLAYGIFILNIFLQILVKNTIEKYLIVTTTYANFELPAAVQVVYNCMFAILLFAAYIKLFKYFSFNKTMAQLNNTISKCGLDIAAFSIMFFVMYIAYALTGYLLFGPQIESYNGFGVSMLTLLRTILGEFDYAEIENANPVLAPFYFISYIFFVFFVLLNMFLAIINDTYSNVKTEIAITADELQLSDILKQKFHALLTKYGCSKWISSEKENLNEGNATIQAIREALEKCGFTNLEIKMFFAKYNIDPTASVGEYDVKELTMNLEKYIVNRFQKDVSNRSVDEFMIHQKRFEQIEKGIHELLTKVDELLKKLDILDNVKKTTIEK